jgi:hypothetical protein
VTINHLSVYLLENEKHMLLNRPENWARKQETYAGFHLTREGEKAQHLASILPLSRRAKPPKPAAKFPNFQAHGDDEERDP